MEPVFPPLRRFFTIYNPDLATPIEDEALRERFERKRDADLGDIHSRMKQIGIEPGSGQENELFKSLGEAMGMMKQKQRESMEEVFLQIAGEKQR